MSSQISRRNILKLGVGAVAVSMVGLDGVIGSRPVEAAAVSDIDILNFALTLEHLEATFYEEGLIKFTKHSDFAFLARVIGGQLADSALERFENIRAHERTHVDTLISVIKSLGGTPVTKCTYNFGYTDAVGFVKVAQALENTGVMAYDGAIALIQNPNLRTAGATIATVEARHASYLNLIRGDDPFPSAFDTPKTMAQILAIAGQFIVSCP